MSRNFIGCLKILSRNASAPDHPDPVHDGDIIMLQSATQLIVRLLSAEVNRL